MPKYTQNIMSCFLAWVKAAFPIMSEQVIAIDGKTLRCSPDKLKGKAATHWVKLDQIVKIESERTEKDKTTRECRYYILNKSLSAQEVIEATRSHCFHSLIPNLFFIMTT